MDKNPFDIFVQEYEEWFIENKILFQSELLALKQVVPVGKTGVEIGIGTGIFAEKLDIKSGIDPSENMMVYARKRGLNVVQGVAEKLPYPDSSYDFAAFITSICFVSDPGRAVREAFRIIKTGGEIIIAIIDKETTFGKFLESGKRKSRFYKGANFFSVPGIISLIENAGFKSDKIFQTLEDTGSQVPVYPIKGYGKGSFVVIKGVK
jgi:ubiquinone/menaquinone biosynthesis C-methylase UbiE